MFLSRSRSVAQIKNDAVTTSFNDLLDKLRKQKHDSKALK